MGKRVVIKRPVLDPAQGLRRLLLEAGCPIEIVRILFGVGLIVWTPESVARVANRSGITLSQLGARRVLRRLEREHDESLGFSRLDVLAMIRQLPDGCRRASTPLERKKFLEGVISWKKR